MADGAWKSRNDHPGGGQNFRGGQGYRSGQGGQGGQGGRGGSSWNSQPGLPEGYLNGGYFSAGGADSKRTMKREYILDYPKQIADGLDVGGRDQNRSAQIRKFYDYCIRIRDALEQGKSFAEVEGDFCRLSVFAKYAQSRGRVSGLFVQFIEKNVNAVRSKEDLFAFVKHFEAIVAYIKK